MSLCYTFSSMRYVYIKEKDNIYCLHAAFNCIKESTASIGYSGFFSSLLDPSFLSRTSFFSSDGAAKAFSDLEAPSVNSSFICDNSVLDSILCSFSVFDVTSLDSAGLPEPTDAGLFSFVSLLLLSLSLLLLSFDSG